MRAKLLVAATLLLVATSPAAASHTASWNGPWGPTGCLLTLREAWENGYVTFDVVWNCTPQIDCGEVACVGAAMCQAEGSLAQGFTSDCHGSATLVIGPAMGATVDGVQVHVAGVQFNGMGGTVVRSQPSPLI